MGKKPKIQASSAEASGAHQNADKRHVVKFIATHFAVASATCAIVIGGYEHFIMPNVNEKIATYQSQIADLKAKEEGLVSSLQVEKMRPAVELVGTLKAPGNQKHDYIFTKIDADSFSNGGTLKIKITLGTNQCRGSFDLFPENAQIPTNGLAIDSLANVYDLLPGQTKVLTYTFTTGTNFEFGAEGNWDATLGDTNSYRIRVTVE